MTRQRCDGPQSVIRDDIRAIKAYSVQRAEGMVKLDAMENPYPLPGWLREQIGRVVQDAELNRYPDPEALELKSRLRELMNVPDGCDILLGNGSDEIIAMVIHAVSAPQAVVMAPAPGFVMYGMSAMIAKAKYVPVPIERDFSLDAGRMVAAMQEHRPAVVFISYPNNPTGNLFAEDAIVRVIEQAPGLVVIDEAYQTFARCSFMPRLGEFPNLVVMRTLSKLGLAGLSRRRRLSLQRGFDAADGGVQGVHSLGLRLGDVRQALLALDLCSQALQGLMAGGLQPGVGVDGLQFPANLRDLRVNGLQGLGAASRHQRVVDPADRLDQGLPLFDEVVGVRVAQNVVDALQGRRGLGVALQFQPV